MKAWNFLSEKVQKLWGEGKSQEFSIYMNLREKQNCSRKLENNKADSSHILRCLQPLILYNTSYILRKFAFPLPATLGLGVGLSCVLST